MGVRVGKETEAKKMQGEIWSQSPDRRLHLDSSAGLPSVASLKNGHLANFCIPPQVWGAQFLTSLLVASAYVARFYLEYISPPWARVSLL